MLLLASAAAVAAGRTSAVPLRAEPYGPGQYFGDPGVPHDVAALAAASHDRPVVLAIDPLPWGDATALIAYARPPARRHALVPHLPRSPAAAFPADR